MSRSIPHQVQYLDRCSSSCSQSFILRVFYRLNAPSRAVEDILRFYQSSRTLVARVVGFREHRPSSVVHLVHRRARIGQISCTGDAPLPAGPHERRIIAVAIRLVHRCAHIHQSSRELELVYFAAQARFERSPPHAVVHLVHRHPRTDQAAAHCCVCAAARNKAAHSRWPARAAIMRAVLP